MNTWGGGKKNEKIKKDFKLYEIYMLATDVYCQITHSMASVTEPDSSFSPFYGRFTSFN